MSSTLPAQFRPRQPKKKKILTFWQFIIGFIVLIAVALGALTANLAEKEKVKAAVRIDYGVGSILKIRFGEGDLASDLTSLTSKLKIIDDAGFKTIVLPTLQPGLDFNSGDVAFRAISEWNAIDNSYGNDQELRALIEKAKQNEQRIILTLPTYVIAKENAWTNANNGWILQKKAKKDFAEKLNLTGVETEQIEFLGGPGFLPRSYVEVVKAWKKEFNFDGVFVDSLPGTPPAFNSRTLEMLRSNEFEGQDFIAISNSNSLVGNLNSGFSATISNNVLDVLEATNEQFDPEKLAFALAKVFESEGGPTQLNKSHPLMDKYFVQHSNPIGKVGFSTLLSYSFPGIPLVESNTVAAAEDFEKYRKLNQAFANLQKNVSQSVDNKVEFFVAENNGTVGFAMTRNGHVTIVFLNANAEIQEKAMFTIPQPLRKEYTDFGSNLKFKIVEDFEIDLDPFEIRVFTEG